jgi:hypothetical protein
MCLLNNDYNLIVKNNKNLIGKEYKINGITVTVDNVYSKQINFLNKPDKYDVFVSLNKAIYSWDPIYQINDFLRKAVPVKKT